MIVGTAGHVDHGKTALVRALTGVDTDRLKEEKARGITIDLGFAYLPGADGATIGFVDVPGHERLVRTMVAGAAGIDLALLVVAADDGIMPQTREHLDILCLLGLTRGLIVVTKCDRVDDARRLTVAREIAAAIAQTPLAGAETIFVSAHTGHGIDALRERLRDAAMRPGRHDRQGVFRLSIDRSFSLPGVGTIAAGLVLDGHVSVGDEVNVMPAGRKARVRSLHAQNQPADQGRPGDRCALALAGIAKEAVPRGAWLCGGETLTSTARLDTEVSLLASAAKPLGQWTPVHFHCGASESPARLVVLSAESLTAGTRGLAQIVLDSPLPLRNGDRFVLRNQSARHTIGGGRVLDPRASVRKRRAPERMNRLDALVLDNPADALRALLALEPQVEDLTAFATDHGLTSVQAEALRVDLSLTSIPAGASVFVWSETAWLRLREAVRVRLAAFHAEHPDLPGIPAEQLRLTLRPLLPKTIFIAVRGRLLADSEIALRGHTVHLPQHVAALGPEEERLAALMTPLIEKERYRPPRVRDMSQMLAFHETNVRGACKALVRVGDYMEIAHDRFFLRGALIEMAVIAQDLTQASATGYFAAAEFRDRLDNGRKVAIEILEYFDRNGLTNRQGDMRRVVKDPGAVFGTPSK